MLSQIRMKSVFKPALLGVALMSASAAAIVASPALAQPQVVEDKAEKAFPLLRNFLMLPAAERDKITLVYFLKIKRGKLSDVNVTLTDGGQTQKLTIQNDGRLTPLPTLAQMNNGATIKVTGPDGLSPALRLKVVSTLPAAQEYDAAALKAGKDQANRVGKKVAGIMAGLVPKLENVYFQGAASGVVIMADGSQTPLPSDDGDWFFAAGTPVFSPAAWPQAVKVRLNTVPGRVVYAEADNK